MVSWLAGVSRRLFLTTFIWMKQDQYLDFFYIDNWASKHKYLQLSESIITAIEKGRLDRESALPSINELSFKLEVSRDTVEKSYKHLKGIGYIKSIPGKGYYVENHDYKRNIKVLLLFNKLSAHKKIIFDAFVNILGNDVQVDLLVYDNKFSLFKDHIARSVNDYSHYVIAPYFIDQEESAIQIINQFPEDKLVLLDRFPAKVKGNISKVCQDFENNIFYALEDALPELQKYSKLKIIFSDSSYFPKDILTGFNKFCRQYRFSHSQVFDIRDEVIESGDVYIDLVEEDLVILCERATQLNLKAGTDIGILSYNETALKKMVFNGISTISTDFEFMGSTAAKMVLNQTHGNIDVPFRYTKRNSL